jgi:hypothetical protein
MGITIPRNRPLPNIENSHSIPKGLFLEPNKALLYQLVIGVTSVGELSHKRQLLSI